MHHPLLPTSTAPPAVASDEHQARINAAVAALADNTRKAYGGAWSRFESWATAQGAAALPAVPATIAAYLDHLHVAGASPATIRQARAAVAKVHQVSGADDPAADSLVSDTLKRIGRDGRERGRGQVAGIGWASTEAAATLAANGGGSLAGLRDAAIIRLMSDTMARISEVAALNVADISDSENGATVLIKASKTDQQGDGQVRYIGAPTVAALKRYLLGAGITEGPVFVSILKNGHPTGRRIGTDSIRAIIRKRAGAVDAITGRIGGHSLRVGSAKELAADGASLVELQQAGGWRSPTTPAVYVRAEAAARGPMARRRYGVGK